MRFADFPTITRVQTLPEPTSTMHSTWQATSLILEACLPTGHLPVRLREVGVSGFDASGQSQGLRFDHEEQQKYRQLDSVVDQIQERFGGTVVGRARGLDRGG